MPQPGFKEWLAAGRVLRSGKLLRHQGADCPTNRFEANFAAFMGSEYALTLTSGTVALHAAMTAIGVGPGDEVLVPAYTWIATAAAPVLAGAVPVLVEIDESLTIDPADIERKITPQTKAIIPVHMVNAPCDMDAIMAIARRRGLTVVEDACQAVGVSYKGRMCGSIGDIGVYSFNQFKNMTIGEGGAVVTNDSRLYGRLLNFHDIGIWAREGYDSRGEAPFISSHARMTSMQGAMLDVQLKRLPGHVRKLIGNRKAVAKIMEADGKAQLSPHHDPASAATLTLIFDSERDAVIYARRPGVSRIYDNSKHVYTNWDPILNRRTAHPEMSPWAWAKRDITYDSFTCPRTLDIMRRSCRLSLGARLPSSIARVMAKALFEHNAPNRPYFRLLDRLAVS